MTTQRVTVTMTLDIDPEVWAAEYGCDLETVEGDVEEHATNIVVGHFSSLGLLA